MSGAEGKVRLLTRADLERFGVSPALEAHLGECGLIAEEPEPVDPRKAACQAYLDRLEPGRAGVDTAFTFYAGYNAAVHDLGREAARPLVLTRNDLYEAAVRANIAGLLSVSEIDRLHTAITQQMEGRDTPPEPQP